MKQVTIYTDGGHCCASPMDALFALCWRRNRGKMAKAAAVCREGL